MSDQAKSLGGRLPLLDAGALSAEQKRVYDRLKTRVVPWSQKADFVAITDDGSLIGPFNSQLRSPVIDDSYLGLVETENKHSSLSKRVRELVILAVGSVWKSDYELYAHRASGRMVGLSEAALDAAVSGHPSDDLDDQERAAYRFARQLSSERRVDPDLYAEAERLFGERGLVDMTFLVGIYHLVCGFLAAFDVPVPEGRA